MALPPPKTIGILGAAIAGPTLALQILSHPILKRAFRPVLIDQTSAPGQEDEKHRAGASVSLFANGLYPLYKLGLQDAVRKHSYEYDSLSLWKGDLKGSYRHLGTQLDAMWSHSLQTGVQYFERHALQGLLLDQVRALGGEDVSWGKKASEYRALDDSRIRVAFTDGDALDVDVLVGADGGYSSVRRFILDQRNPATAATTWLPGSMNITGFYGISEGIKAEDAISQFSDSHCVWLDRGFLATGPLLNNKIRWDFLLPEANPPTNHVVHEPDTKDDTYDIEPWKSSIVPSPYPRQSSIDVLRQHRSVFHPYTGTFERLLLSAERIIRSPLRQRAWKPEEITWGNAVLIGDASRLMLPTSGQGTGFAIEDATVLAGQLLRYASSSSGSNEALQEVLREYSRLRYERSKMMALTAGMVGKMGMGNNIFWRLMRNSMLWMAPAGGISRNTVKKDPWPMDGRFNVELFNSS